MAARLGVRNYYLSHLDLQSMERRSIAISVRLERKR